MLILDKVMAINSHITNKKIEKEKNILPLNTYFEKRGGQGWSQSTIR